MPTSCCAFGCTNNNQKLECQEKKISFHLFPLKDPKLVDEWLVKIKRKNFKITKTTRICSAHFEDDCFVYENFTNRRLLKPSAVPTKFVFNELQKPPRKRTTYTFGEGVSSSSQDCDEHESLSQPCTSKSKELAIQTEVTFSSLLDELLVKQNDVEMLKQALCDQFDPRNMSNPSLNALTGFESEMFFSIFNFLNLEEDLFFPDSKMSPLQLFFMFMIKLRTGITHEFLSVIFKLSTATVSRNLNKTIHIIYLKVKSVDIWPAKAQVKEFAPYAFRKQYPDCRLIIDCTEIKIQKSYKPTEQQLTFSYYKNCNTLKSLIGISPSGVVSYISNLWCGSISDKELFLKSGLLNLLEAGDIVLADRGFTIAKELERKGCLLVMPHFLKDKIQFNLEERAENKNVSHLRVHVERAIGRIKIFKLFEGAVPYNLLHNIDKVFYIAAFLTNFNSPLINVLPPISQ